MSAFLQNTYHRSPVFLQNWLVSAYGYYWEKRRQGGRFDKELKGFKERESFSQQEWRDHQTSQLRKILVHAFETVPFYNRSYKAAGLNLSHLEKMELENINQIPMLEKESLRKFGRTDLISRKADKGNFYSSSGSTGTPTSIYFSKAFHQKWAAAYEARVRHWAGVSRKDPRGMIGGRRVLPESQLRPPFFRYNFFEKQTYFSAYHISPSTAQDYLDGIIQHKVQYMVGYAMSNYFLAKLFMERGLKAPQMKAVLTSSEKLLPEMREIFKKVYGCKTYDSYSGVEACGLVSENESGELQLSPDTGILEILDENLKPVEAGSAGEVVSTGLMNFDQPLIRYRIGDRMKLAKNQSSKTGREMLIIDEMDGRVEDVVIGADGRQLVRFHGIFINIPGIICAQVIQQSLEDFRIRLVVDHNFSKSSESLISDRMTSQLGQIRLKLEYLKEIPKNKNGKFQAVVSNMSPNSGQERLI